MFPFRELTLATTKVMCMILPLRLGLLPQMPILAPFLTRPVFDVSYSLEILGKKGVEKGLRNED